MKLTEAQGRLLRRGVRASNDRIPTYDGREKSALIVLLRHGFAERRGDDCYITAAGRKALEEKP